MFAQCAQPKLYRPRKARASPLYRLLEKLFDQAKGVWEERFEKRYGRWRGCVDDLVNRFLDCGVFESGFARVRCPSCRAEYFVAFSCQTRSFCPSCAAKRSVMFAQFLEEEVLADVGHWMLTFTIPKMLRPYFLHHRKLLGEFCKAAWQTFLELMVEAVGEDGFRPAMVALVHSAGAFLRWNPHVHALAVRGGWLAVSSCVLVNLCSVPKRKTLLLIA